MTPTVHVPCEPKRRLWVGLVCLFFLLLSRGQRPHFPPRRCRQAWHGRNGWAIWHCLEASCASDCTQPQDGAGGNQETIRDLDPLGRQNCWLLHSKRMKRTLCSSETLSSVVRVTFRHVFMFTSWSRAVLQPR